MRRVAGLALVGIAALFLHSVADAEVTWGVKGGLAVSDFRWEQSGPDTDTRKGACIGVYLEWPQSSHVTLTGELLYVQKGGRGARGDMRIDCLSIPVVVRLDVPTGDGYAYFGAGARTDVLVGSSFSGSAYEDLEDSLTAVTFGTEVLVGYDFGRAQVGLRYSFDLTDSVRDGAIGRNDAISYVLGVSLGTF